MNIVSAGSAKPIVQMSSVVVYDPGSGRIVHLHHFVTSEGGTHPDEKAQEEAALASADLGKADAGKLAILHADPSSFQEGVSYQVDTEKRALIERSKPGLKG